MPCCQRARTAARGRRRLAHLAAASAAAASAALAASGGTTDAAARAEPASVPFRVVEAADVADAVAAGERHVLDVRSVGAFLGGHVPGAVHLDDERLRGPAGGLPVQLLDVEETAALLAAAGVRPGVPVLVVGAGDDPLAATFAAWSLLRVGHPDVAVLDGGWPAWAGGHPVTRTYAPRPAEDDRAAAAAAARSLATATPYVRVATLEEIRPHVGWDTLTFVDARPTNQYRGEVSAWPRPGHVPGAISLPWRSLAEADNAARLRPRTELERIVREAGIRPESDVVVYCGTGREATKLALVLEHVLGHERVRLYAGSWTEYSAHPDLPADVGRRRPPAVRVHRDGRYSFSGQPDVATLRRLKADGVTTIVNCRSGRELAREMPYDDALLARLGLRTISIPLGGEDGYGPDDVDRLAEVLASTEGRVHLHCGSGSRARALWTAWLIRHEGLSPDEARARAARVGAGPDRLEQLLGERIEFRRTGRPVDDPED